MIADRQSPMRVVLPAVVWRWQRDRAADRVADPRDASSYGPLVECRGGGDLEGLDAWVTVHPWIPGLQAYSVGDIGACRLDLAKQCRATDLQRLLEGRDEGAGVTGVSCACNLKRAVDLGLGPSGALRVDVAQRNEQIDDRLAHRARVAVATQLRAGGVGSTELT